ncbi:MAG: SagB/ThcOx family dehydrogenase, partial [Actinomycetota bacterium]|nr:SagB/ThcOx family dehydrogenase [Actinomycetota bacterium]
ASSLGTVDEVRRYREGTGEPVEVGSDGDLTGGEPLAAVIRRRGSARNFTLEPMPAPRLAAILEAASAHIPGDLPRANEIHLIANAVEGVEPGAYRFRPPGRFELLKAGSFRSSAGYLALEQEHAARAAATHFLTAELEPLLGALGNRGYRAAQLEAGIRAGRLYLGAYARGLGATGLTFYDDEVGRFFTGDTRTSAMLCVAVGPDARRRRS